MSRQRFNSMSPFPKGAGVPSAAAPKGDMLSSTLVGMGLLLVITACALMAYPAIAGIWGAYRAESQFSHEIEEVQQYDDEFVECSFDRAREYNAHLAGDESAEADVSIVAYDDQLDIGASDVLCWLDIPKIGVTLPVFRDDGTEEVPPEGAEHVRGTSLPVGGVPSNTVITAHSGAHGGVSMAFNRLEALEDGDSIVLWTLGQPFAYKVVGWEIVAADATSIMKIPEGADELTLLTCRPIGTTAKRLIVHAERTDYFGDARHERSELLAAADLAGLLAAIVGICLAIWLLLLMVAGRKTVWYLNRVLGLGSCSPDELARIQKEGGLPSMRLELKRGKRAKLVLFGVKMAGAWRRMEADDSKIRLAFNDADESGFVIGGLRDRVFTAVPAGTFEASAFDGELAFLSRDNRTLFVFSRHPIRSIR